MDSHRIHVTIAPDGAVKLEVEGVQGEGCLELTAALEDLLGGRVEDREMKDSFYESVSEVESENLWG